MAGSARNPLFITTSTANVVNKVYKHTHTQTHKHVHTHGDRVRKIKDVFLEVSIQGSWTR
jgi:hypothetical protein